MPTLFDLSKNNGSGSCKQATPNATANCCKPATPCRHESCDRFIRARQRTDREQHTENLVHKIGEPAFVRDYGCLLLGALWSREIGVGFDARPFSSRLSSPASLKFKTVALPHAATHTTGNPYGEPVPFVRGTVGEQLLYGRRNM